MKNNDRSLLQNMIHKFFQHSSKPEGMLGNLMIKLMNSSHAPSAKWSRDHLKIADGLKIIDLGCGGGINIKHFLKTYPTSQIYGLDYSPLSVEKSTKENSNAIKAGRCKIIESTVESMPFEDNYFDVATAFETIYFWKEGSFDEVYRVLKSGGIFFISYGSDGSKNIDHKFANLVDGMNLYSEDTLKNLLEFVGFKNVVTDSKEYKTMKWHCITAEK